jgi:hypothetical protein
VDINRHPRASHGEDSRALRHGQVGLHQAGQGLRRRGSPLRGRGRQALRPPARARHRHPLAGGPGVPPRVDTLFDSTCNFQLSLSAASRHSARYPSPSMTREGFDKWSPWLP